MMRKLFLTVLLSFASVFAGAQGIQTAGPGPGLSAGAAAGDPHFASVVLLAVNDNAADGTTTVVDQSASAKTITTNGNAQYDTAQAPTGMTSSMLLDGTGDYLSLADSADWAFGSGDFTMELMLKHNTITVPNTALAQGRNDDGAGAFIWAPQGNSNKLDGYWTTGCGVGTRRDVDNTAWAPGTTNWYHLAWVRSGVNMYMFVNGTQHGSTFNASTDSMCNSTMALTIGADVDGLYPINGWISNVRITKGVARYTSNFTPPTLPFPTN